MGWIKAKDRLPQEKLKRPAKCRDEYLQILVYPGGNIHIGKISFANVEILEEWYPELLWLDESEEPNQEALWNEVERKLVNTYFGPPEASEMMHFLTSNYTITRK